MDRGYIKLWRKTLEDPLWHNMKLWRFFEYCLLRASYREHDAMIGMQIIHLEPGQFIFGRHQAAKECSLSEQEIRTCIEKLKKHGKLAIKTTNKFSIISIMNWERYQDRENEINQQINQQLTNKQPTTNHIQEGIRKERRDKNKNTYSADFELFWQAYPNKTGKKPAWEKWQRLNSRRPDIDVLLAAIEKQKQSRKWREGYIANPATWLHQERWNDMPLETNPLQGVVSDKTMRTIENLRDLELT